MAYYTAFSLPPLLYLLLTMLTFGLSTVYEGNQAASNQIDQILETNRQDQGKWWKALLGFAGIIVGATGVVAALQDSLIQVWQVTPDPEHSGIKNVIVQAAVIFIIFAAIFKFMPDAQVEWRDVMVGSAITTSLFLVGRFVLQVYFSYSEPGAQLGAAAASLAVMYGRGIVPEDNAVRVVKEYR